MNNITILFTILEALAIGVVIILQAAALIKTRKKIKGFQQIFPDSDQFEVITVGLLEEYLKRKPSEILVNLPTYMKNSEPEVIEPAMVSPNGTIWQDAVLEEDERINIDLINCKGGANSVTGKIVYSLNTYLIKNRGAASDFHLIKDVVERNAGSVEDDINQSVSQPLYMGLLGTFFGIVWGLVGILFADFFNNSSSTTDAEGGLDHAIQSLLIGVMIAMIASFFGLAFTIWNSRFFREAKRSLEDKKNDFYTFIQTELLPLLNQNINSTLYSLQNNLHRFNEEFKGNISRLSAVMNKNYDALKAQDSILNNLQNMDINALSKANVEVLRQLQLSTTNFAQFNQYLTGVNKLIDNTKSYTEKIDYMLTRTNNLNTLAEKIVAVFEENKTLAAFLQNHYNSLDESHQLISHAVNNVSKTLLGSLNNLEEFTNEKIQEVRRITLKEVELMQRDYPERWKKLEHLGHLEGLNTNLAEIKMSSAAQIGSLKNEVIAFNTKLSQALTELKELNLQSKNSFLTRIGNAMNKMFQKKKVNNEH